MLTPTQKVRLLAGGTNTLITGYALGYGVLLSGVPGLGMPPVPVVLSFAGFGLLVAYTLGAAWIRLYLRPIDRALAGGLQTPADAEMARRRVLDLPVQVTRASTIIWIGCAILYPLFPYLAGLETFGAGTWHVMLATVIVSTMSGGLIYYLEERHVRSALVPLLLGDGRLSAVIGTLPVPIEFKFLVMVLSTAVLPIVVLTSAAWTQALTPAVVLYLGSAFFIFGLLQSFFIARSIDGPVESLADAMERVTANDLTARAPVLSTDALGQLAEGFNSMVEGLKRAEFVRDTFGRYVAPAVVDAVLSGQVALGGELRQATVLFSDIRDFTALTEAMPPAEVVAFLNSYLDAMVEVVVSHGGTVDKFIGDAVMATFGVPVSRGDDALRAVRAGVGMLERLETWNLEREKAGKPKLAIGIGLHTGEVLAGNIGSTRKMEYTVIGDTVNTASRIESLNKALHTRLLISAATFALVQEAVVARELEPVEVKGKREKLVVHEVTALRPLAP